MKTDAAEALNRHHDAEVARGGDSTPQRANLLLAVALLAVVVRLVYLWQIARAPFFALRIGDAAAYHDWALRIARGDWRGEGVFYQAPLYPYVLALVYRLVGDGASMIRLVHLVISTGSCVMLAAAGLALFGEAGAIAGVLLALYPPAIFLDALLDKTVLVTFFTTMLLWLLARRGSLARDAFVGVTLGLLALTRENALLLAVPIAAWLAFGADRQAPVRARRLTAFVAGCAIVLLPVALRNAIVGHEFALTTSQFGPNLYIGNHEGARGLYDALVAGHGSAADEQEDATQLAEAAVGRRLTPAEVSTYWTRQTLRFVRAHPVEWAGQLARKAGLTLNALEISDTESQDVYAEWSSLLRVLAPFTFGVVLCLAAIGACLTAPDWRRLWFLHALAITYAFSVVVFYVFGRYRFPLVPMLLLFAAGGIAWWRRPAARRLRAWAIAAGAAAAIVAWLPLQNATLERVIGYVTVANALAKNPDTWMQAAAFYDEALGALPRSPAAHWGVGRLLAQMNRPADAIPHYQVALEGWPDNDAIRTDLALAEDALRGSSGAPPPAEPRR